MEPLAPRATVIITDNRFGESQIERSILEPLGIQVLEGDCLQPEEVLERCREADALLVNLARIDGQVLRGLPRCKVVSRYGVGLDNVDCATAATLGVKVYNVPDYCGEDVAQHSLGLALALLRDLPSRNQAVHHGGWNLARAQYSFDQLTVGVLGFGSSGQAFCRLALAMRPRAVLVYSPNTDQQRLDSELGQLAALLGVELRAVSRETALEASDLVSIHLRLSDESRALINQDRLARMKHGVFIVNTARGAIIDSLALRQALDSGQVAGAALDVLDQEPPAPDHPLLGHPSVILTDHCAYRSVTSLERLRRAAARNVAAGLGLIP